MASEKMEMMERGWPTKTGDTDIDVVYREARNQSLCLSVCLSVFLSVSLSVCLSVIVSRQQTRLWSAVAMRPQSDAAAAA